MTNPTQTTVCVTGVSILLAFGTLGGCGEQSATESQSVKSTNTPTVSTASNMQVLKFKVTGMHCQGCANGIKGTLAKLPGVVEADASFADGTASVKTEDPSIAPQVIESIAAMKYKVEPINET